MYKSEDPDAAQRSSSAFSGIGAFTPGNSTLFFLGALLWLDSRISPSSVSSLLSPEPNIVIPDG